MPAVGKHISREVVLALFESGKNPSAIAAELRVNAGRVRSLLIDLGKIQSKPSVRTCGTCDAALTGHGAVRFCDECVPDARFNNLYHKYGITKRDYDRMFSEQDGKCALCDRSPTHVDHCHSTGIVRGLLCTWCNSSLGRIDDDPNWAERALVYRSKGVP